MSVEYPHIHASYCFFFNDTATTEIYTLSLHDALPIYVDRIDLLHSREKRRGACLHIRALGDEQIGRAHVELQSQSNLVCRLLLEKKKLLLAYSAMASTWQGSVATYVSTARLASRMPEP